MNSINIFVHDLFTKFTPKKCKKYWLVILDSIWIHHFDQVFQFGFQTKNLVPELMVGKVMLLHDLFIGVEHHSTFLASIVKRTSCWSTPSSTIRNRNKFFHKTFVWECWNILQNQWWSYDRNFYVIIGWKSIFYLHTLTWV